MMLPLDHTGDVGFGLEAESLENLFDLALQGLLRVAIDRRPDQATGSHAIHLLEPTLEHLMVAWLDELIFLLQTQELVPVTSKVVLTELPAGWELRAMVATAPLEPEAHRWRGEIKAATFHGLAIEPEADGWRARIILDV